MHFSSTDTEIQLKYSVVADDICFESFITRLILPGNLGQFSCSYLREKKLSVNGKIIELSIRQVAHSHTVDIMATGPAVKILLDAKSISISKNLYVSKYTSHSLSFTLAKSIIPWQRKEKCNSF